ncbi:HEC/Ndc80p family protein, putative [Eimeria mitis]|uniref:Kinetochore protein NDC80 n=1 Tax=Eimeria mitis TaxID=44415 RepID=U6K2B5_9EIME|nr:HEC/Ndc80p family protein, putative [Eimeria mitis]CDJ29903.1 HEC/Ndc80p family protein, putative [Eimeria mitis]
MEPLMGGPTSPFRLGNTPAASAHPLETQQQPRELSDFSFYKTVSTADKALHSTYKRGKRSAEATKLKFLSFSEFPGPLSAKALSSPQRSLLIDIWGHLFRRCFDDSVKITAENVNDEVPRLFKEIGYPFPISKSAMLAPGTGHQWPHHLAALSWLCELLIYENEFFYQEEEAAEMQCLGSRRELLIYENEFFYQEEEAAEMQAARGDIVGRMFAAAYPQLGKDPQALRAAVLGQLHGMNREAEATQQQLQQQLQQRQQQLAAVEAELRDNASLMVSMLGQLHGMNREAEATQQQLQQQLQQRQQQLAAVEAELRDNASLMDSIEQLKKDISSLRCRIADTRAEISQQDSIEQLKKDISSLRCRIADTRAEISQQESLAAATEAERDSLLLQQKAVAEEVQKLGERIKAQGIDKAEVERIRHDVSRLRDGLSHRSKEIESLSEGLQALIDKEIESLSEGLQALIDKVNECLSSMSQLAVSAKLPTAEDWSALPKMETANAAAAAAAAAPASAAACNIKTATNEIVSLFAP